MAVIEATDKDLRELIYTHDCVIVKYMNEDCHFCKLLAPHFEKLSNDSKYESITFLKIDSGENPIAKSEVGERDMPFFNTFKKGLLIECRSIRTDKELKRLLVKLLRVKSH
jgi:thioredoxin 1